MSQQTEPLSLNSIPGTNKMDKALKFLVKMAFLPLIMSLPALPQSSAPSDEDVRETIAQLEIPDWDRRPTIANFRASEVYGPDGNPRPITLDEFRESYRWKNLPYTLAQKYYPEVLTTLDTPEGYTLAFLLRKPSTVVGHKALALQTPDGEMLLDTLSHLFPNTPIPRETENGSVCFPRVAGKHGAFCVEYAYVTDSPT